MVKYNTPNKPSLRALMPGATIPSKVTMDTDYMTRALFYEENSFRRSRRARKSICYDVTKLQKEERRTTRLAAIAARSEKAKAATRKRKAKKKAFNEEADLASDSKWTAKKIVKLMEAMNSLRTLCEKNRGQFWYAGEVLEIITKHGQKVFNYTTMSTDCLNDIRDLVQEKIIYEGHVSNGKGTKEHRDEIRKKMSEVQEILEVRPDFEYLNEKYERKMTEFMETIQTHTNKRGEIELDIDDFTMSDCIDMDSILSDLLNQITFKIECEEEERLQAVRAKRAAYQKKRRRAIQAGTWNKNP